MRYLQIILYFLILNPNLFGQSLEKSLIKSFWISEANEVLNIGHKNECNSGLRNSQSKTFEDLYIKIHNDTLIFYTIFREFEETDKSKEEYQFKVLRHSNFRLVLTPINYNARLNFDKDSIIFKDFIDKDKVDNIDLEEFKIDRSGFNLLINKNGKIILTIGAEKDLPLKYELRRDKSIYGSYEGYLNKSEFDHLKLSLVGVGFLRGETFKEFKFTSHSQKSKIEIKYNNKIYSDSYYCCKITMIPLMKFINKITSVKRMNKIE